MELRSNLLSSLLANVDESRRLTVLDLGPALPETVDFFSQFKCRLYFADLYSDEILNRSNDEVSSQELRDHFSRLFNYSVQTKFDICLFWDVLNYLDGRALQAFSEVLNPFLADSPGIHGFGVLKASAPLSTKRYAIIQADCLKVRSVEDAPLSRFPHPQIELNKSLYGLKVGKATLLSGGLVEMLFKRTD